MYIKYKQSINIFTYIKNVIIIITINKKKIKEVNKQWRIDNADKIKEHTKQYRAENLDKIKEHTKQFYIDNRDKIREKHKQHYNDKWKKRCSEKINCECGFVITKGCLLRHLTTQRHINGVKNKTD